MDSEASSRPQVSLWSIFFVMLKVGAFTIGGGYAMMLIIQREFTKRGWLGEEEFPDLMTLSQTAPGLIAVNISIFTGYKLRGIPGALVATLGSCFPPFAIILAIAMCFTNYADSLVVEKVFKGMRPAVVALIAVPMVKMARSSCKRAWQWALAALSLAAVAFAAISPVWVLLTVIMVTLCVIAVMNVLKNREGKL